MEIRSQLITRDDRVNGWDNPVDFITVHETANRSIGAGAQAHANLQSKGNVRNASWHWQVDDKVAIQSFSHNAQCWHAGVARGNNIAVAIEICVNPDSDLMQAYRNAAALVHLIRQTHTVPLAKVVQHHYWSGKNCPTILRAETAGLSWTEFIRLADGASTTPPPAPKPTPAPAPEVFTVSSLPNLDWRKQNTSYDAMDERVQGLLAAADCYAGRLDGRRGPQSVAGLRKFQVRYNCGNGRGGADMLIGPKNWESLLLGKRWP